MCWVVGRIICFCGRPVGFVGAVHGLTGHEGDVDEGRILDERRVVDIFCRILRHRDVLEARDAARGGELQLILAGTQQTPVFAFGRCSHHDLGPTDDGHGRIWNGLTFGVPHYTLERAEEQNWRL